MSQARQLRVLCSSLALVAVLATGAASARVGQKSQIRAIKAGGCAHDSARQRSGSSSDSRTNPARASALSQYDAVASERAVVVRGRLSICTR